MRITNQLTNTELLRNYQNSLSDIYKFNAKLTSGLEIQNSYDDSSVYVDGVRLDYEISTIDQVSEAAKKAIHYSKNSDKALQEFVKQLENFKVKLIQAGNESHSSTSLGALADELQGIKNFLVDIANTSINGQYLFSGSSVTTKPIGQNNAYMGNNEEVKAVVGSHTTLAYNIPGETIFYGTDSDYSKHITTNIKLTDKSDDENIKHLTADSKIMHLIGKDYKVDRKLETVMDFTDKNKYQNTVFYLQGVKPNNESFNAKFEMTSDASMQDLMDKIGEEFGNTKNNKVVDVYLNKDGQINIVDLKKGNQAIDFYMVAATQQSDDVNVIPAGTSGIAGNANTLEELEQLKNDPKNHLLITEFIASNYTDSTGAKTNAFDYDKVRFQNNGSHVTGTISQTLNSDSSFAKDTTKLSEVAAGEMVGSKLEMKVSSKSGKEYTITLDFTDKDNAKVNFKGDGIDSTTPIYHGEWKNNKLPKNFGDLQGMQTPVEEVTFKQLNDIIAMAVSDNIPADGATFDEYNKAIDNTKGSVEVSMDYKGRIDIKDMTDATSKIKLSLYDPNGGNFTAVGTTTRGPNFTFSANNAITIDEPSNDIFNDLDEMIKAVRFGYYRSDTNSDDPRNAGIQGALKRIDHISDHVIKSQTKLGSMTNSLEATQTRAQFMKVNVSDIKNELIGADYAETYMKMTQHILSYQAMLQASAKIQQLSLLNYM